jgi:hypothetical protein
MCQLSLDEVYFILLSIRSQTKSIVYPPGTTALVSPGSAPLKGGGRAFHKKYALTSLFQPLVRFRFVTAAPAASVTRAEQK